MPFQGMHRFHWGVLVALLLLGALLHGLRWQPAQAESGDSPSYLIAAHALLHGHATALDGAPPAIGREPAYPLLLAGLMAAAPGFRDFAPACVGDRPCPASLYLAPQIANLVLVALAALALLQAALWLGLAPGAALIAPGYLLLNGEAVRWWVYVMSDPLALCLAALAILATQALLRRPSAGAGALAGLVCAGFALTKYLFAPLAPLLGIGLLCAGRRWRAAALSLLATSVFLLGGWALAGRSDGGDSRAGITLHTREVFNHMSGAQYAAAFVYWTRGFGDDLARRWFAPETVAPFDPGRPGGFYDDGQFGRDRRVAALQASGVDRADAIRAADGETLRAVLERPLTHLATTVPLFWRGLWIDEFIVLGLPCLAVALHLAWRDRRWDLALALAPGVYSLLAYALISLNIPRYQMTALPSLALATACIGGLLFDRWRARFIVVKHGC